MHSRESCGWDTSVVFVERVGQWWWNAWNATREVERSGYAETCAAARAAHAGAVAQASK